jgi:hypothetical protein
MSDHERGAYTPPTDAPLSFDARQPVRGTRPAPLTLIVSILVLAGLAVAIFMFYRSGVRQAGQPPQAVGTPVGELKAPPPAEAQPQDPAAGLQIYKSEGKSGADAAPPQFTPPPEQPQPRAPAQAVVVTPPAAPAPAAPPPALRPAIPAQPAPAPVPPTASQPKAAAAPAPPAAKVPPPAPAKPKPAPVVAAVKPPAAPPAKAAPVKATPAKTASGGAVVQIGAVSSAALADKAWADAVAAAPGLGAGKGKSVEKIDKNGATLFRTAVTGFADRAAATAFCDKLKAAGKSCFVR